MAVFTSYFDASGSESDPAIAVLTVAGYIATEEQWAEFDKEWSVILAGEGVATFHMKDFAQSRGEFKDWKGDEERRKRLVERLSNVIGKHTQDYFSTNLMLDDYRAVNLQYRLSEFAPAYVLASQFVVGDARKWMEKHHPAEPHLIVLEKGDAGQEKMKALFKLWGLSLPVEPCFVQKESKAEDGTRRICYPLQASDLLAYEQTKLHTDHRKKQKTNARGSMMSLLKASGGVGKPHRSLGYPFFKGVCDRYNLEKR